MRVWLRLNRPRRNPGFLARFSSVAFAYMTDIELSFNILLELQTVGRHLERPSEENRKRKTEYQEERERGPEPVRQTVTWPVSYPILGPGMRRTIGRNQARMGEQNFRKYEQTLLDLSIIR